MPGPTRRRYSHKQKVTAVLAADQTSTLAAAEATGIPRKTIAYWLDQPEFATLRQNAREKIAEEVQVVARLAWQKLALAISRGELEGRDLVTAAGLAVDKSQLLNGGATARTEARDITGTLSDAELAAIIREADQIASGRAATPAAAGESAGE